MKFTMEIEPETNPNAVGEYLRSAFFDEKERFSRHSGTYRETGCYEAFDWQKDAEPLENIDIEEVICPGCQEVKVTSARRQAGHVAWRGAQYTCTCVYEVRWTRARKAFDNHETRDSAFPTYSWIECRYYWDGDGTLAFILPDGQCLVNTDCKKDHGWRLVANLEDI